MKTGCNFWSRLLPVSKYDHWQLYMKVEELNAKLVALADKFAKGIDEVVAEVRGQPRTPDRAGGEAGCAEPGPDDSTSDHVITRLFWILLLAAALVALGLHANGRL